MPSPIRDFLQIDQMSTNEMSNEELRAEVEGWRMVISMVPNNVLEWVARLREIVRFTNRRYEGNVGVLLSFKMEPTEFTIGLQSLAWDSIKGRNMLESKTLVIPTGALMYQEFIDDIAEFNQVDDEEELGAQSLSGRRTDNGKGQDDHAGSG